MNNKPTILLVGVATLAAALVQAQTTTLLPATAEDLVAAELSARIGAADWPSAHVEAATLHHQHLLIDSGPRKPELAATAAAGPSVPAIDARRIAESRQYWVDASGAELGFGIDLPLTAPGAILRISAADDVGLMPEQVRLRFNGREVAARELSSRQASGAEMRRAGWAVPSNSLVFALDRRVGVGTLRLRIDRLPGDSVALVHVFEPASPYVARLELDRQGFLAGQVIDARLHMIHPRGRIVPQQAGVMLVGPDASRGEMLEHRATTGSWSIVARRQVGGTPGALHELQAHVDTVIDGVRVRRDLSHAVAVSPALGRLTGTVTVERAANLRIGLDVSTAIDGRFQVRGTLHATDKRGQQVPVAVAETAALLSTGSGRLTLQFDLEQIEAAGYRAPYELRDLMLFDQGRMLTLESRQRALVIDR